MSLRSRRELCSARIVTSVLADTQVVVAYLLTVLLLVGDLRAGRWLDRPCPGYDVRSLGRHDCAVSRHRWAWHLPCRRPARLHITNPRSQHCRPGALRDCSWCTEDFAGKLFPFTLYSTSGCMQVQCVVVISVCVSCAWALCKQLNVLSSIRCCLIAASFWFFRSNGVVRLFIIICKQFFSVSCAYHCNTT